MNEYFGRVERDGRALHELPVYAEHQETVFGSVAIPRRNQDTFGRDVEDVIARKLTLQEAIESPPTTAAPRVPSTNVVPGITLSGPANSPSEEYEAQNMHARKEGF